MSSAATRIGGVCGIAAAAAAVPAYVVGSPDLPKTADAAGSYYESASSFLTANGTLPLLHLLFGVLSLAVLIAVLRAALGPSAAVYIALIGGTVFLGLTAAGLAAEVAVPAAIARFGDVVVTEITQPFLALSFWLYHCSQIGSATLIFATAFIIWRTGVFPKVTAALAILGVLPLLHTWYGLPAAYSTVVWVAAMGIVLLLFTPKADTGSVPI